MKPDLKEVMEALELDPGKKYLIFFAKGAIQDVTMRTLRLLLRDTWGIDVMTVPTLVSPADAVKVYEVKHL